MKGINNHNQTNRLIKLIVIALDFVALWLLLPMCRLLLMLKNGLTKSIACSGEYAP